MLKDRWFKLKTPTLAIEWEQDKRRAVSIPAGAVLKVITNAGEVANSLVTVFFNGRIVQMFAEDVRARAEELATISLKR